MRRVVSLTSCAVRTPQRRLHSMLRRPATAASPFAIAIAITPPHLRKQRRWQSGFDGGGSFIEDDDAGALESELASVLEREGSLSAEVALTRPLEKMEIPSTSRVRLEKLDRPPARFDLLTNSLAYRWQTTAKEARKVCGPMREWATELKYRTGCHIEAEPTQPERLLLTAEEGGYATADEVDMTVYVFGSERGVFNCHRLMESIVDLEPAYVRLGVFRRVPDSHPAEVEWLLLRRINREMRPPDIPPISLKLPGKWTLLYEQYKEAAMRSLWEETGISVESSAVFPTARLEQTSPAFYWRVPVHYFVAEVPYETHVLGPQVVLNSYMHHWDARLLRQSPDPIDRAWAQHANPETGCAWMRRAMIDDLQQPLRGDAYMAIRYTPPPYSNLAPVLGFELPEGAVEAEEAAKASMAAAEAAAEVRADAEANGGEGDGEAVDAGGIEDEGEQVSAAAEEAPAEAVVEAAATTGEETSAAAAVPVAATSEAAGEASSGVPTAMTAEGTEKKGD